MDRATCDSSPAQQFIYNIGPTFIRLANSSLCVEFGPGLGVSGRPLRLQTCGGNGAQGQQLLIDGPKIRLRSGPRQCADVTGGLIQLGIGRLQSWRCINGSPNQVRSSTLSSSFLYADIGSSRISLASPRYLRRRRRRRLHPRLQESSGPSITTISVWEFSLGSQPQGKEVW